MRLTFQTPSSHTSSMVRWFSTCLLSPVERRVQVLRK